MKNIQYGSVNINKFRMNDYSILVENICQKLALEGVLKNQTCKEYHMSNNGIITLDGIRYNIADLNEYSHDWLLKKFLEIDAAMEVQSKASPKCDVSRTVPEEKQEETGNVRDHFDEPAVDKNIMKSSQSLICERTLSATVVLVCGVTIGLAGGAGLAFAVPGLVYLGAEPMIEKSYSIPIGGAIGSVVTGCLYYGTGAMVVARTVTASLLGGAALAGAGELIGLGAKTMCDYLLDE
jgi:hypothetical protein